MRTITGHQALPTSPIPSRSLGEQAHCPRHYLTLRARRRTSGLGVFFVSGPHHSSCYRRARGFEYGQFRADFLQDLPSSAAIGGLRRAIYYRRARRFGIRSANGPNRR